MSLRIVFGLGNQGKKYEGTRHNIGFEVLDAWAKAEGVKWKACRFADALEAELSGGEMLLKPQTFMNLSGEAVRGALKWNPGAEWLVVVDDAALPVGQIRLRGQGSSGGHNGLESIEACAGTREYPRLRVGVGRPEGTAEDLAPTKSGLAEYVLGRFSKEEQSVLKEVKEKAIQVIKEYWAHGLEAAMTFGNKKA
ncbi:MAG: aminoacyl-tRNA hydrolase [bacterium]